MNNILSWLDLAFTGLHAIMHFFNYDIQTVLDLTIPFVGPCRPGCVGFGIIGSYFMMLVVISFQFRRTIGQKIWRTLHYLSFAVFVVPTVHGLSAGTDRSKLIMQIMYFGSGLLVFFLTTFRLTTGSGQRVRQQQIRIHK